MQRERERERERESPSGGIATACYRRGEVSDSIPGWGGHITLCDRRRPSDYVCFNITVKRKRFHTFKS